MVKYVPPSFNRATVREGLLKAMGFGEPTRDADKVTFHFPRRAPTAQPTDQDGIPFDPAVRVDAAEGPALAVTCAVEYLDRNGNVIEAGEVKPSGLRIALLDEEYQQVKAFSYVVAGGDRYARDSIDPPVALGSIDVWIVRVKAEDER